MTAGRAVVDRQRLARRAGRWAGVVAAAYVLAGVPVGVAAAVLAVWHLWRPPRPAVLLAAAVAGLAGVPVVWIAGNADRLGAASPQVVGGNPWPGPTAAVALLLLVVGVVRDRQPAAAGPGDRTAVREGAA